MDLGRRVMKIFPVGAIRESPDNLWQEADVAMQDLTLMGAWKLG